MGTLVVEYGVSLAKEFEAGGYKYSIGVRPKIQNVETILYFANANNFDSDDFDDDNNTNDDSNFNLDVGGSFWLNDNVIIGLTLRDLVGQDYETVAIAGTQVVYEVKPSATAGIAYNGSMLTAAIDVDLTERNSFDVIDGAHFVKAGVELNMADWVKLRAGYRADINDNQEDVFTLGFGLSPFNILHLDVAALAGSDNNVGGQIDIKFTF